MMRHHITVVFGFLTLMVPIQALITPETLQEEVLAIDGEAETLMIDEPSLLNESIPLEPNPDENNELECMQGTVEEELACSMPNEDLYALSTDQNSDIGTPLLYDGNDHEEYEAQVTDTDDFMELEASETGPTQHTTNSIIAQWTQSEDGDEPSIHNLSQLNLLSNKDIQIFMGGRLKDDFFTYQNAHTLRSDYHDNIDFFRHRLNLDFVFLQGSKKFGQPSSEACVRFTNYVFWQKESNYTPITVDEIALNNTSIAHDLRAKTLLPLIFVEQAFFKLNFDTFLDTFKDQQTFFKIGYFPYTVGRGVTMGFHEDLAIDYLGWAGDGGFTRYPFMPPGILFHTQLTDNLSWELYYNLWRETNASLADVLESDRSSRLFGNRPERGSGKDRTTWVTKLNFYKHYNDFGNLYLEPYLVYVNAPEQQIELPADASAKLFTPGIMIDWHYNNWSCNIEIAGQFGHQHVHGLDRNITQLKFSKENGAVTNALSHVVLGNITGGSGVADARISPQAQTITQNTDLFEPLNLPSFIALSSPNHELEKQQNPLIRFDGQEAKDSTGTYKLFNSATFGNNRFRKPYQLKHQGFLALMDMSYLFEDHPFKICGSLGYISGDNYPYNDEVSKHYNGFVPLRSRYRGLATQNFFMFDRQTTPRPLNISYRSLYAFNNLKDLSNLQFVGLGATWYPLEDHQKLSITTNLVFLWEATRLKKWDKNGKHPDPTIEEQLVRLRNTINGIATKFSGWETQEHAHRMLGTELYVKTHYKILDHCSWATKFVLFFPGKLYKDLDGQPNIVTHRFDELHYEKYDGIGHQVALAFVTGLHYQF